MKKEEQKYKRYNKTRIALLFWCLFIGIGAVAGAVGMLTAIDGSNLGMQSLLPYFQVLPFAKYLFQDFFFPGMALLCVNGLPNLIAAFLLFRKKKAGLILGTTFGVTLMLWICIQFVIFPANFMSTTYFFFGLIQTLTGYAAWVFYKQETFIVDSADYKNIGSNPKELVVFFSRQGYVKKKAYESANESGACLYEVKCTEETRGTLGFWWCGRYGMHRWEMPIEEISIDLEQYEKVTICTPIWVFHLAAPMRAFCEKAKGKIRCADYILVHFQKSVYRNAYREMDERLGVTHENATSYCCRHGKYYLMREK